MSKKLSYENHPLNANFLQKQFTRDFVSLNRILKIKL